MYFSISSWLPTIGFRLTLVFLGLASSILVQSSHAGTVVRIETSVGGFAIELFDEITPGTVANFLNYVNSGRYSDTVIHRSEPGFVIQGGWLSLDEQAQVFREVETDDPIVNEFNVSNTRGTIAMAKLAGNPDSATSQWFFNLTDNLSLDTNNGGFTVFGEVIGDGMSVVDSIAALPTQILSSSINFRSPLIDFDGNNLTNANLVNLEMTVLPNVYEETSGVLTLRIDAPGIGLLKVAFNVVSVSEGVIQADENSVEELVENLDNMATFDSSTSRLHIPELAVNGEIVFRNVVLVLTDGEQLLFRVESFDN